MVVDAFYSVFVLTPADTWLLKVLPSTAERLTMMGINYLCILAVGCVDIC